MPRACLVLWGAEQPLPCNRLCLDRVNHGHRATLPSACPPTSCSALSSLDRPGIEQPLLLLSERAPGGTVPKSRSSGHRATLAPRARTTASGTLLAQNANGFRVERERAAAMVAFHISILGTGWLQGRRAAKRPHLRGNQCAVGLGLCEALVNRCAHLLMQGDVERQCLVSLLELGELKETTLPRGGDYQEMVTVRRDIGRPHDKPPG